MTKKPVTGRILALLTAVLTMTVMCLPASAFAANGITKDETVYVVTDSSGTQQDVIVSDHLINKDKVKTIEDKTNLKDVENVKGEETFKQNGESITWNAEGNGIYYQGRSEDEIPVTMDIVYRLNDKVVTGSELQGQSGKVEIKINYTNDAEYEGTTVPFVVMTGMVITDDSFKHIKIDNGKVIDDGDKLMVVGMAAPGLAQTLDIAESDLGIGSSVTISGDADKFAVEDMMTVVTNSFFEDVDTDKLDDLDYDDEIKELDKGAKALVDGSDALYEGLNTMAEKMPDLQDGVGKLNDGAHKLKKGTNEAKKGAKDLASGSATLSKELKEKLNTMLQGVTQLVTGSDSLYNGLTSLKSGAESEKAGMEAAADTITNKGIASNGGAKQAITVAENHINEAEGQLQELVEAKTITPQQYSAIMTELETSKGALGNPTSETMASSEDASTQTAVNFLNSSTAVDQGVVNSLTTNGTKENPTLYDGIMGILNGLGDDKTEKTLINGANKLNGGLSQMQDELNKTLDKKSALSKGLNSLNKGTSDLAAGEEQLSDGAKQLADGMAQLDSKAGTLADGVDQLSDGSRKLSKGMSELYKQGIKKIVDLYNDDLKGTLDSADAMMDAGKGYKTFTRLPAGMDGNVKFVYRTDMTN